VQLYGKHGDGIAHIDDGADNAKIVAATMDVKTDEFGMASILGAIVSSFSPLQGCIYCKGSRKMTPPFFAFRGREGRRGCGANRRDILSAADETMAL
jgi:hypothetical protein